MKSKIIHFLKKNRLFRRSPSKQNNSFEALDLEMQAEFPDLAPPSFISKKQDSSYAQQEEPVSEGSESKSSEFRRATPKSSKAVVSGVVKARLLAGGALMGAVAIISIAGIGLWSGALDDNWPAEPAVQPAPIVEVTPIEEIAPIDTVILGEIMSGDTLANLMTASGASRKDTHLAASSFNKIFSARKLRPGQKTSIRLIEGDNGLVLEEFMLEPDLKRKVITKRQADGSYSTVVEEIALVEKLSVSEGVIESSLYVAATQAKVPSRILADMINIFSFDVDFQREIQKNDSFALMYESMLDAQGREVDTGQVLVAEMTLSGVIHRYYRFKGSDKFADYYDAKGQSVRKALLRTPVDGARISSGFGKRKHPISGYTKMHKGADFAAPRGTPIYAAGNGVVEAAGWNGGYGKYVRIRHTGSYKTAYAHMHQIAKGISNGKRVRQRQIIGYVGTTGSSTGNHLHFEVHKNGRQVNPLSVKLPSGRKLKGKELAKFKAASATLEANYGMAKSPPPTVPETATTVTTQ